MFLTRPWPNLMVFVLIVICWSYVASEMMINWSNRSDECQDGYKNLSQQQMTRFIDASGKPGSGLYGGNTLWYGSYSECQKIPDSRYCLTIFPGSISIVPNKTEPSYFEWGICVPNFCTSEDVSRSFTFLFKTVSGIKTVTPFTQFVQVKCARDPEYTASVIITIAFCGLLIGICLLATIVEMIKARSKPFNNDEIAENGCHISMGQDANEQTPLIPDAATKVVEKGITYEILHSFSLIRNIKCIMDTNVRKSDLTYLHGIRVLSLFWIILYHVTSFVKIIFPYVNLKDVISFDRRFASMVLNTAYGVDTFFVLSGLLLIYTSLSKKAKNNGQTNWFKYYFHRYWRLTPTLMFFILFSVKLRPFFGAGPLWFLQLIDSSTCSETWWKNILYVNDFTPDNPNKGCLPHTWYLAADMQFFFISPIFIFIAYRYRLRPLLCAVGVTVLSSIIVTACLVAHYDTIPMPDAVVFRRLNTFFGSYQEKVMRGDDSQKDIYFRPYCRIPPYVMAMVLGYVLHQNFSKEFKLSRKFVAISWFTAIALALTVVYAPYSAVKEDPRIWTTGESVVFWSLKWPIWSMCIIWLIFACHYNYAGLVKNILGAKFWIPLSRINYAAFIIHMDVLMVVVYNIESPIHFTTFTMVSYYLSALVLTYASASVITVLVELPCANLEALAWRKWEKKKQ